MKPLNINVLIVDDEKFIGEIWEEIFDILGCRVFVAESIDKGISILTQHNIQLVITDLRMPEANGSLLLDYLTGSCKRDIDIFVCSGFSDENKVILERSNVIRMIAKPFSVVAELDYFRNFLSMPRKGF
ncbi:MAG: DNA-binding NtrC family response regulator [Pseudohongiellaceae bacterium]